MSALQVPEPASLVARLAECQADCGAAVRVLPKQGRYIEHHQRQNHVLEWNLVHGDAVGIEMSRRVDMRAVLADHGIICGAEAVLLDRIRLVRRRIRCGRHRGLAEPAPDGRSNAEGIREINKLLAGYYLVGVSECGIGNCGRDRKECCGEGQRRNSLGT